MAESLLFSLAEQLFPKLASFASQEAGLVYGVKDDVKRLEQTLSTIKAVLLDAEMKQETSLAVKNSTRRLKEVVYDADDLLEDVATENLRRKAEGGAKMARKVSDFFSSSNQLAFRHNVGHRAKDIRERLDEIAKDMSIVSFVRKEVEMDTQAKYGWRETDSFILEPEMIGREEDKGEIIKQLLCLDPKEKISVIAIVGFGGLGKTALAQLVYTDQRIAKYFDLKFWVCVSEESNVKMLVKKILEIVTGEKVEELSLEVLQSRLRGNLEGKKYLLVLDDIWNINNQIWSQLRKYLMVGSIGSKILVTTRSKRVCLDMGVESPYDLKVLTDDQSWDLFEKLAFTKGQGEGYQNLVELGKEIVRKCKGVPLAIKTLGGMMSSKTHKDEWLSVLSNDIWRLFESGNNDIGPVLKLSYDHLPIELRQCFVYCSIFPKDYEFWNKDTLIQLWIAQGYIQPSSESENKSLEDIGDDYFNELLFRSFFQKDKSLYGGECYKMHDLIHDLAQSIAGDSCFMVNDEVKDIPERVHHVYCESSTLPPKLLLKDNGLRTLFLTSSYDLKKNIDAVALNCTRLRALSLCHSDLNELNNSIGKLKHLRYLDLSQLEKIVSLPNSVCNLHSLQTLNLSLCNKLIKLPRDVRKLISLRHLMISGGELKCMPVGLGKLIGLRTLPYFKVATARDGGRTRRSATLNELNSLNQLRGVMVIEGLENVKKAGLESSQVNLKEKKHLHTIRFIWNGTENSNSGNNEELLDNLQPHPNLKHLYVLGGYGGVRFSNWISSLTNLVQLEIRYCPNCKYLPQLDHLPCIKILCLSGFLVLEYISFVPFSSLSPFFPSLKELEIDSCHNMKGWWSRDIEPPLLPEFPCLSKLNIDSCPNLTLMPTFPSLDEGLRLWNASIRPLHETMKVKMMSTEVMPASSSVSAPLSKLKTLALCLIEDSSNFMTTSLLDGMHQLTSLKKLAILDYPQLSERCGNQMAADWPNIAHIPNILIDLQYIQQEGRNS